MFYQGQKWKKKAAHIRRLDGYKDVVESWFGRTVEGTHVHHIYPAKEYPQWQWADWNLITVSLATHNKLENRMTGELTEFGEWLQDITEPNVDWRKRGRAAYPPQG